MSTQQTEIQLIISAQNKANAELSKLGNDLQAVQAKSTSAGLSVGKLAGYLGGAAAVYGFVKKGIIDSITAWEEQEKVIKQTEAVIKSTGGAAGMTTQAIGDLASEMQNLTTYGDEQVQAGENLLLTFTNIGKDVFPQATQTMLDMSTALGQDLKGSAIQLGKALQDPILGVTALRRVGVNFNATQQETIKNLVETGKGLEAQKMILKELATEFGGSAKAQLETFGGRMQWLKNQVGDFQESIGAGITRGLIDGFNNAIGGIDNMGKSMNQFKQQATIWSNALVNGFIFAVRALWNVVQSVGRIIATPFTLAYGAALDAITNIKNLLHGDFTTSMDNFKYAWSITAGGIGTDIQDIQDAFQNGLNSVDNALMDTGENFKVAEIPVQNFGDASEEMGKKVKEAAKKISDLKDQMKDAVKSAKQDIKDLKKEFKEQENEKEADFTKGIATIIVDKQKELADLKKQFNEADTAEEKNKLAVQAIAIQDFLKGHLSDQQKYAKDIAAVKNFQALDEIQQLKVTYAEEKKQREKDYKAQMEELKDHLKDVEKEYKKKLKDLKKDLKEELGGINISIDIDKKKKRALGGAVMAGSSYIVGEHRPEVFVPSQSGNIKPSAGNGIVNINFGGVSISNEADENRLVEKIKRALAMESSLGRMGIS